MFNSKKLLVASILLALVVMVGLAGQLGLTGLVVQDFLGADNVLLNEEIPEPGKEVSIQEDDTVFSFHPRRKPFYFEAYDINIVSGNTISYESKGIMQNRISMSINNTEEEKEVTIVIAYPKQRNFLGIEGGATIEEISLPNIRGMITSEVARTVMSSSLSPPNLADFEFKVFRVTLVAGEEEMLENDTEPPIPNYVRNTIMAYTTTERGENDQLYMWVVGSFAGGTGTAGDPYQISTCTQLQNMNTDLTASYELINNIDCSATTGWNGGAGFQPIGWEWGNTFRGTLNGQGYEISGLHINRPGTAYQGLFGYVYAWPVFENIVLRNFNITGGTAAGGLIGILRAGSVNNVLIKDSTVTGAGTGTNGRRVGGLIGHWQDGGWRNVENSGAVNVDVTGTYDVGGLIGYVRDGQSSPMTIRSSFAKGGTVTATEYGDWGAKAGGLIGRAEYGGTNIWIYSVYANMDVIGTASDSRWVGGLIGHNNDHLVIRNSYATGSATAYEVVGGFSRASTECTNCYWDTNVTGNSQWSIGTQKTTSEMKNINTYPKGVWPIGDASGWHMRRVNPGPVPGGATVITNCTELQNMQNDLSGTYYLGNDIDCSATTGWNGGAGFEPMGSFTGTLDGNGYEIRNLYINRPSTNYVGLFSYLGGYATVKDLTLSNFNVTGQAYTGGLAGRNLRTHLLNVVIKNSSITGTSRVGGLIGLQIQGGWSTRRLEDVAAINVDVTGSSIRVGGVIGSAETGSENLDIYRMFSSGGTITSTYSAGNARVGGLIGRVVEGTQPVRIFDSYSTANIWGYERNLGVVVGGYWEGSSGLQFWRSYGAGHVHSVNWGSGDNAGFVHSGGTSYDSFCDLESGNFTWCGAGATGKTTSEMKSIGTFSAWGITEYDYFRSNVHGWVIESGQDYPRLAWGEFGPAGSTWVIRDGEDYPRLGWELIGRGRKGSVDDWEWDYIFVGDNVMQGNYTDWDWKTAAKGKDKFIIGNATDWVWAHYDEELGVGH